MKKAQPESMLDILESTLQTNKGYEQIVADGACIERLLANPDFARYQRLLAEAYLQLVERLRLADPTTLPALQGALIQSNIIMKLPQKFLDTAMRMVQQRRQDAEGAVINA